MPANSRWDLIRRLRVNSLHKSTTGKHFLFQAFPQPNCTPGYTATPHTQRIVMHTNTSSSIVISRRVLNKCKYAYKILKKRRKILKYAVGMSNRYSHQKKYNGIFRKANRKLGIVGTYPGYLSNTTPAGDRTNKLADQHHYAVLINATICILRSWHKGHVYFLQRCFASTINPTISNRSQKPDDVAFIS